MPAMQWNDGGAQANGANNVPFNPAPSTILHVDLNAAYASIEQLADPFLRGRPVAVAAYASPRGCILAASYEAKRAGVKTGMRVAEGKTLCRDLAVLPADPPKYRHVHRALKRLLSEYTDAVDAKSIDEFVLDLTGCALPPAGDQVSRMHACGREIKQRIRAEIGESLTVNVGIAPNRFLAKTAAGLHKPDGLDEIHVENFRAVYARLRLMDLCGIAERNCARLNAQGIYTVTEFFEASAQKLKAAFQSVEGYHWHTRLHGWNSDDVVFDRHSFGNGYALPQPWATPEELAPVLMKLIFKSSARMRHAGYACRGVHVALAYRDGAFWHQGVMMQETLFDPRALYKIAFRLLCRSPHKHKPVRNLAVQLYELTSRATRQESLWHEAEQDDALITTLDRMNDRYGDYVLVPALMMGTEDLMPDRISFGSVKEQSEG